MCVCVLEVNPQAETVKNTIMTLECWMRWTVASETRIPILLYYLALGELGEWFSVARRAIELTML